MHLEQRDGASAIPGAWRGRGPDPGRSGGSSWSRGSRRVFALAGTDDGFATVVGRVVDETGAPVPGAEVGVLVGAGVAGSGDRDFDMPAWTART